MIKFHLRGVQELFWRAGRSTEKSTFRRLIKKHPTQAKRALKVAQQKGLRKVQALGKRHGIEGLGVGTGIKTIKKFKPSKIRPRHLRGKDFPDLADDPTIGGVKAYADMPGIKGRASAEAKQRLHGWGFRPKTPGSYKIYTRKKDLETGSHAIFRERRGPKYIKHKNLSSWWKSGKKIYKD
jgi:hypothetical protein